jgi:hypothetical protein
VLFTVPQLLSTKIPEELLDEAETLRADSEAADRTVDESSIKEYNSALYVISESFRKDAEELKRAQAAARARAMVQDALDDEDVQKMFQALR